MPRYVILEHDWPEPHFDLFMDAGEALQAWKLPADFSLHLPSIIEPNANHRRHYLDFEGEIAGGRGVALRWDFGEFEWVPSPHSVSEEVFRANFAGHQLKGIFEWRAESAGVWHFARVT